MVISATEKFGLYGGHDKKMLNPKMFSLTAGVICIFIITLALTGCPTSGHDIREKEVESGVHAIQIAIETYAVDHDDYYPEDINDLIDNEVISEFPNNPMTEGNMEPVEFGSENLEGNFTYIPDTGGDEIMGYYIFAYGLAETEGTDVDGDGVGDQVCTLRMGWMGEESDMTPLEELLN